MTSFLDIDDNVHYYNENDVRGKTLKHHYPF